MSTFILSACWRIEWLSPAQKLVLVSLADQANDDGVCWPSIRTLGIRTCLSERAIRDALRALEEMGLLTTGQREGRSSYYTVTPANGAPRQEMPGRGAGNAGAPRQQVPPTPAADAPITYKEPTVEPSLNQRAARARFDPLAVSLPTCIPKSAWETWCAHRSAKRQPLTEISVKQQLKFLESQALAGVSAAEIIEQSVRNGWTGLFALKGHSNASLQDQRRERARQAAEQFAAGFDPFKGVVQ